MWTENNSLYGNYRTNKFQEIWESPDDFYAFYSTNGIFPTTISEDNCRVLYGLLYSRYGNDPIRSSDQNRFKLQVMSIIWQYGPAWEKKLMIQKSLRDLTIDQLREGSYSVSGAGQHPGSTLSDTDIKTAGVNDYSRQNTTKGYLEAYGTLNTILDDRFMIEFIDRFKSLFRIVVMPEDPLYYKVDAEEE